MFKLQKNPQFTHDVPVLVPVDGGHQEQILKTRFRVRGADDLKAHDTTTIEGTEDYLRAIVVRFEDVLGEDGEIIPQSDALTDELLALPYVRIALFRAYTAAVIKARQGN